MAERVLTEFQSTSPVRGTTWATNLRAQRSVISIHVPRAGDDDSGCIVLRPRASFQSTSPVRGTTFLDRRFADYKYLFQSTSPVRGTTVAVFVLVSLADISIHVPRAGDDPRVREHLGQCTDFNPRPPCGGRPRLSISPSTSTNFNPRPPCGGRQQKLPETGVQFRAASAKTGARAGSPWEKAVCFAGESRRNAVRRRLGKSGRLPLAPGSQVGGGSFRRQAGRIRSSCRAV